MRCNGRGQAAALLHEPRHGECEKKHLHGAQGRGQRRAHLGQVQHCKHGRAYTRHHEPAGAAFLECAGDCLHRKPAEGNLLPHRGSQAGRGQYGKQRGGTLRGDPRGHCPCSLRTACRQRHCDACECSRKAKQSNQACGRVVGRRRVPVISARRPSPRPKGQAYKRRDTGEAGVEGICSHA